MLFFGPHTAQSATGVQQGDLLGPLLFFLAIHVVVKELSQLTLERGKTLDMTIFHLDDGIIAGDIAENV